MLSAVCFSKPAGVCAAIGNRFFPVCVCAGVSRPLAGMPVGNFGGYKLLRHQLGDEASPDLQAVEAHLASVEMLTK